MEYNQGLIIDGTTYDIPLVKIDVTFDFLEKYAERVETGEIKLETIGGYQNYTIEIGTIDDADTYQALWDHVTDATNRFHKVILPDTKSTFEFYGYFSSIKSSIEKVYSSGALFKGFSWKMTEKNPTKTP